MSLDIKVMPLGPISANCYILTDKKSRESAVIDPGDFNEALKNAVKDLNIKYILLTHGHFDHILGVCGLKEFTGAKVLIHKLDGDVCRMKIRACAHGSVRESRKRCPPTFCCPITIKYQSATPFFA